MAQTDDYDAHDDPGWFRDQLRQRDRLIVELRREADEATDLNRCLREHAEDYVSKRYNKLIPFVNGKQDAGRPLAASEAQVAAVLKLHRAGNSLRAIVEEFNLLSLRTVRTIVDRKHGTDRTTKARRLRIEIDKQQRANWKAQKRTGDALPKFVEQVIKTGKALVIEANGLGRAR